jgi:hypothetical protein
MWGSLAALPLCLPPLDANAQTPAPAPDSTSTPAPPPTAEAATPASSGAAMEALIARVDAQAKALADTQKKLEEVTAQVAAIPPPTEPDHKFQFYGYTDLGLDGSWSHGPVGKLVTPANTVSFAVGNIDLYMDAQPLQDWRSLVEIRFSNAPQGSVTNYGGIAGTFSRTSTFNLDPNAATADQYVLFGSTVIERAQIDWTHFDFFKLRVGLFLTPFGIWNTDHGTPTLIALQLPQALAFNMFPSQQTGVMAFGNHQFGRWDLGYMATMSNGRQDISNFHFAGNPFGYGARIYANDESGKATVKFGLSLYTDRPSDQEIDIATINPVTVTTKTNVAYREVAGGADFSLDIGSTRIRSEAVIQQVTYVPGEHEPVFTLAVAGAEQPNRINQTAYVLLAQQLPFLGLEPFVVLDSIYGPLQGLANFTFIPSAGLNIHFTPSVQLKTQVSRTMEFNVRGAASNYPAGTTPSLNDLSEIYSRLVVVF